MQNKSSVNTTNESEPRGAGLAPESLSPELRKSLERRLGSAGQKWWIKKCIICDTEFIVTTDSPKQKTCGTKCGLKITHNAATKHGLSEKVPEYFTWEAMRRRCLNPNEPEHKNYGARGITICSEWDDFAVFLKDIGKKPSQKHSIHRINNNGNYEPSNCKWATAKEQCRNTRRSRFLTFNGKTATVAEWAEIIKIPRSTLGNRLFDNWSTERALGTPWKPHKSPKMKKG